MRFSRRRRTLITRREFLVGASVAAGGAGLGLLGCTNASLPSQRRAFPAPTATEGANGPTFPLLVSENGRYLLDQQDRPFRIQGDSAQSMIVNLTLDEAAQYLDDRSAKGFNTVNVNLLEHKFAIGAPANRRGDAPFLTPGDFSTPNDAYFEFAEEMFDRAERKGFLVSLAYMYLGSGGGDEGWWAELNAPANTQSVCYRFGQYLGGRFERRNNLLLVVGGDYTPPRDSEGEMRLRKIFDGVRDMGAAPLQAGDWTSPCLSTDEPAFVNDMTVNAVYTYGAGRGGQTYMEAGKAFDYRPIRPAYLKETGYEAEGWIPGDPASVRKYQYWAILGGATAGGFYGHRDIWEFATDTWSSGFNFGSAPWQTSLDAPGAYDWQRLGQLLDSLNWYDLVPVDANSGPFIEGGGKPGDADHVVAASTAGGEVTLAYLPPTGSRTRTLTLADAFRRDGTRTRWFDPSTGEYVSAIAADGGLSLTTPGLNGAGASDWVLRIDR